jgi:hypothetical protein
MSRKKSNMLQKRLSISVGKLLAILALLPLTVILAGCPWDNQTTASTNNAQTAQDKWGASPNIKNFNEYHQLAQIYEARDNPNIVLNAYLFSDVTGQLTCLGKVKGFGVPYGTSWSQPMSATQGSIPEPNALYPSTSTNADWLQLIDPVTGKTHLTFMEPNIIITDQSLPCKLLIA